MVMNRLMSTNAESASETRNTWTRVDLQLHPERHEEQGDEEVAQAADLGDHVQAVRKRRERHAGDQRAHRDGEVGQHGHVADDQAPADRRDHDDLRTLRDELEQGRQHVPRDGQRAHHQPEPGQHRDCNRQDGRIVQVGLQRQHDDGQHVLHQQDAECQAPIDRVKLALIREQLDHDHRAGERGRDAQVECREAGEPEQQHEASRQHGAGDDLERPDRRADPP